MSPASSSTVLTLRSTWFKKMILMSDSLPLLSFAWRKDRTQAKIVYFHVPADKLCDLIVRMPEASLGVHLELLLLCPWKQALLAKEALYGRLFSVRHPIAIKHTYYALGQLAQRLPESEMALALECTLALDFEKMNPYFLDAFPRGVSLSELQGIPLSLVLPLLVSREQVPEADRKGFVNQVQSFVGFFSQANITTSDFLNEFIEILTDSDSTLPLPWVVSKLLTLAKRENFSDLLKMASLCEYLAKIGHPLDLDSVTSWTGLIECIRVAAQTIAQEIAPSVQLVALKDKKVQDTFLQILPDYLLYRQNPRWDALQKAQLQGCMQEFLATGSIVEGKYSAAWKQKVVAMLTRQLGSREAAESFLSRWMTPGVIYTYDYSADPRLKQEEINRLEQLHAHVDLSAFALPIPEKYRHLITQPFTGSYYETRRELLERGANLPAEEEFVLLDGQHHAKVLFYKKQAEVRYDPTKPDSVFIKGISGLFREAWSSLKDATLSELDLLTLEDLREQIARMIMGVTPSKLIPDLVETVLERCGLDRRVTPIETQEKLRKRLRESITQHRRQYKDFYDNIMQYKLFRYFHDDPTRLARLEEVLGSENYELFNHSRSQLLASIDLEKNSNPALSALIGDNEIAYLRKLIYVYNFNRALKLFDFVTTRETKGEKSKVHDAIVNYAKLLAHIKSSNNKTSGADARERLESFVDLMGKNWVNFDRLLKQEGTPKALEYLASGFTLTNENRDYLIEVCRNYLGNESRRIYARIELWDSDRFLDWITVARTVYEPHVAHQKSCMHPSKINARTGKTEYLMGYIRSPWVKQLYLGSKDLFEPFDENNKIRCILFLCPAVIDGKELLCLNIQHPYPLNPTREVWRVLMEGCKRLSSQYGLPLLFPDISTEELQHAAIQTRAKLFHHISSMRINVLAPREANELQQRDDCELSGLPSVKDHVFLGEDLTASQFASKYWVILPE